MDNLKSKAAELLSHNKPEVHNRELSQAIHVNKPRLGHNALGLPRHVIEHAHQYIQELLHHHRNQP